MVLVFVGGRPRLLGDVPDHVDAVLVAFGPGPDGGGAVADVLGGTREPGGQMPLTWPARADGAGAPYNAPVSERCTVDDGEPRPHLDVDGACAMYTTFKYTELHVSKETLQFRVDGARDELVATVEVVNVGDWWGSEVVLFFAYNESRRVTPERRRLLGFKTTRRTRCYKTRRGCRSGRGPRRRTAGRRGGRPLRALDRRGRGGGLRRRELRGGLRDAAPQRVSGTVRMGIRGVLARVCGRWVTVGLELCPLCRKRVPGTTARQ